MPQRKSAISTTQLEHAIASTVVASLSTKKETKMLRTVFTGALAIGLVSGAYAQTTGPAAQSDNMSKPAMTNTNSDAVKKSGTTGAASGMSSGGGSGMTDKGGANGTPSAKPKTTTGPAGAASKDESPAK
jgi:hypothetical protein